MHRPQLRALNVCDVLHPACHRSPNNLNLFMAYHMAAMVTLSGCNVINAVKTDEWKQSSVSYNGGGTSTEDRS